MSEDKPDFIELVDYGDGYRYSFIPRNNDDHGWSKWSVGHRIKYGVTSKITRAEFEASFATTHPDVPRRWVKRKR